MDRTAQDYAGKVDRAHKAEDPAERQATLRRITSIKARMADMSKALENLRTAPAPKTGTIIGVQTGGGADRLSIWTQGSV